MHLRILHALVLCLALSQPVYGAIHVFNATTAWDDIGGYINSINAAVDTDPIVFLEAGEYTGCTVGFSVTLASNSLTIAGDGDGKTFVTCEDESGSVQNALKVAANAHTTVANMSFSLDNMFNFLHQDQSPSHVVLTSLRVTGGSEDGIIMLQSEGSFHMNSVQLLNFPREGIISQASFGMHVSVTNSTFVGGKYALYFSVGSTQPYNLTVTDSDFEGQSTECIYLQADGVLHATRNTFSAPDAYAIKIDGGGVGHVDSCVFDDVSTGVHINAAETSVSVTHSHFLKCGVGGCVYGITGDMSITHCVFEDFDAGQAISQSAGFLILHHTNITLNVNTRGVGVFMSGQWMDVVGVRLSRGCYMDVSFVAGSVNVTDSVFENNAYTGGLSDTTGALKMVGLSSLAQITRCVFRGNVGEASGALSIQNSEVHVIDCVFEGNTGVASFGSPGAGAVYVQSSVVTLNNTVIHNNTGSTDGDAGGLGVGGDSSTYVYAYNCTLTHNTATASGGGVGVYDPSVNVELRRCTVEDNTATQNGGGMYCGGVCGVFDSHVTNNTAASGGGMYMAGSVSSVWVVSERNVYASNTASGQGLAVRVLNSEAMSTFTDDVFTGHVISDTSSQSTIHSYASATHFTRVFDNSTRALCDESCADPPAAVWVEDKQSTDGVNTFTACEFLSGYVSVTGSGVAVFDSSTVRNVFCSSATVSGLDYRCVYEASECGATNCPDFDSTPANSSDFYIGSSMYSSVMSTCPECGAFVTTSGMSTTTSTPTSAFSCETCEGDGVVCDDDAGECICADGYNMTIVYSSGGFACEDIDECESGNTLCGECSCRNTDGSYTCQGCDGGVCEDDINCICDDERAHYDGDTEACECDEGLVLSSKDGGCAAAITEDDDPDDTQRLLSPRNTAIFGSVGGLVCMIVFLGFLARLVRGRDKVEAMEEAKNELILEGKVIVDSDDGVEAGGDGGNVLF